jgi:hypothetical protein
METNVVERAFQLAPESRSIDQLRAKLAQEGYARNEVDAHLSGGSIRANLKKLLASA